MAKQSPPWFLAAMWCATDGVAALEFALIAPVVALLLAGIASFGVGMRVKMEVGNAARAGAAYAASHSFDEAKIRTAAQNATALAGVTAIVTRSLASCMAPASGAISSANGATACPGTAAPPGTYVTVTTHSPYAFVLPVPGMATTTTLSGRSIARIQ